MLCVIAAFLAAYAIPVTFDTLMHVVAGNSIANVTSVTPGGVGVTQAFNVASLQGVTTTANATAFSVTQQLIMTAWNILVALVLVVWAFGWTGGKSLVEQSYAQAKEKEAEHRAARRARKQVGPVRPSSGEGPAVLGRDAHGSLTRRRKLWLVAGLLAAVIPVVVVARLEHQPGRDRARGTRLHARLRATNGGPVALSRVAPWLRDAVVATEDERFYRHHGVDVIGVLRAVPYDLVHLSFAQGASTITEQVAKVLYLNGNDHSPWRKLEDAAVAVKLEDRYDKEQILGAYLNSVYFGEGAYGVWRASRRYFGVSPRSLDLAQASMLAGLIQAPSAYDPLRDPALARARQVEVLRAMVGDGFVTAEEAATALGRLSAPPRRRDASAGPGCRSRSGAGVRLVAARARGCDGAARGGRAARLAAAPLPGRSRHRCDPGHAPRALPSRDCSRGPILPDRLASA